MKKMRYVIFIVFVEWSLKIQFLALFGVVRARALAVRGVLQTDCYFHFLQKMLLIDRFVTCELFESFIQCTAPPREWMINDNEHNNNNNKNQ